MKIILILAAPAKRTAWFTTADLLHALSGDTWLGEGWDTCHCVVTRTCHQGGHGNSGTGNRTRIWSGRSHQWIRLTDHSQGLTTAPLGNISQCPVCVRLLLLLLLLLLMLSLLRSHDVAGLWTESSWVDGVTLLSPRDWLTWSLSTSDWALTAEDWAQDKD